jgi:prepilin-type N-terminal cleavage/methylation domain-containing protein
VSIRLLTRRNLGTRAFTLVELLVVITIIVILLALLTPALDQAIYQAELATCGARLKGIAGGVSLYAVDYQRKYPHRPGASGDPGFKPNNIYIGNAWEDVREDNPQFGRADQDDRVSLQGYLSVNGHLNDPLSPAEVDFEGSAAQTQIEVSYHLWFGWQYHVGVRERGMFKVGDRFEWTPPTAEGAARTYTFDFLASDVDGMDAATENGSTIAGHADSDGRLVPGVLEDGAPIGGVRNSGTLQYTYSRWDSGPTPAGRGTIDVNFVSSDTSVRRYMKVPFVPPAAEPSMIRAPMWPSGYPFGQWEVHLGL